HTEKAPSMLGDPPGVGLPREVDLRHCQRRGTRSPTYRRTRVPQRRSRATRYLSPLVAYSATPLRLQKGAFTSQWRTGLVPAAHEAGTVQDGAIRLQHLFLRVHCVLESLY